MQDYEQRILELNTAISFYKQTLFSIVKSDNKDNTTQQLYSMYDNALKEATMMLNNIMIHQNKQVVENNIQKR